MKPSYPDEMKKQGSSPHRHSFCVASKQMQAIEAQLFDAGFPVAALMEKVAGRIADYWAQHWDRSYEVGVLVGPGHNGGDALVVARELHLQGYGVKIYGPFERCKSLTMDHGRYCRSLGIPWYQTWSELEANLGQRCRLLDGLFGFGLSRPISEEVATAITRINHSNMPVVSIDLPSGIHTDSGEALGIAVKADITLCLGLWKRACLQEIAQPYLGHTELIDFDIPLANIEAVLGVTPKVQRLTPGRALRTLPLQRSPVAHKYTVGQLLAIAGSRQYAGAALLTGHGAMASGVGMVTLVVPETIRPSMVAQLPGALVIGAEETATGEIATLPPLDLDRYDTIACGPGLAQVDWLSDILASSPPLLLDADGLNSTTTEQLTKRLGPTVITPHPGEFRRLFPELISGHDGALQAAQQTGTMVVLKGAKVAIASGDRLWVNPHSTPALARGGSGDVLTGLMGGLMAQKIADVNRGQRQKSTPANSTDAVLEAAIGAVWWHAQAGLYAEQQRTVLGVDPLQLAQSLDPALANYLANK
ncbi:NAD(P)H-hydrate dehydratase [Leptothoe sp. LEGE 181152]|nr:NAD(P)H-hydrate dehydratase [Leptothoe sp. LEGE 181152]